MTSIQQLRMHDIVIIIYYYYTLKISTVRIIQCVSGTDMIGNKFALYSGTSEQWTQWGQASCPL